MKYIFLVIMLFIMANTLQGEALIGPQLLEEMSSVSSSTPIEILIVMEEQSDEQMLAEMIADAPRREKRHVVIEELKSLSARTQTKVLDCLNQATLSGKAENIVSLWIVNAVACKATSEIINTLSTLEGIYFIESSKIISENILLVEGEPEPVNVESRTVEWNVRKVAADSCWALGFKGQGVIVGLIDTGCRYTHYDLRNHMWIDANYPHHGWDFENNDDDPNDSHGHGTHCSGTISSDGSAGDSCGMAPQCSIMVCRVRTSIAYPHPDTLSETQVLQAMQFVTAPPLSPNHGADVVSMSLGWYFAWTPRRSVWRKSVSNVALAGIAYFIAAGNERNSAGSSCPIPYNLRCPGDNPGPWLHPSDTPGQLGGAISIAATDINDVLATFSSVGPSCWEYAPWYYDYPWRPGTGLRKPDIAAPGVSIISCSRSNDSAYTTMSGTSMATPCCAGVAALLLSKNPNLTVSQIDSLMQMFSLDLGAAGKDTMYGAGRVQAKRSIDNTPATGSFIDLRIAEFGNIVLDPTPNGNANDFFEPSERITLVDTIVNLGSMVANGVTGILRTTNSHIAIEDSTSTFGNIDPNTKGNNGADPFILSADTLIDLGTLVPFTLALTSGAYTKTLNFHIRMGSVMGPDSVGYFVLDDSDSLYTESPVYSWMEINPAHGGSGTSVGPGGNNVTFRARLPFRAVHYGKNFPGTDSLSICSNGWISFGRTTRTVHHNSKLPKMRDYTSTQGTVSNMVAGYWDSLSTSSPASWWRYYDAANHCFVVQYDSVPIRGTGLRQTFEFLIYDSTLAGPGGHSDIVIQYKTENGPHASLTIGQQDSTKKCGVTYTFNDMWDIGAMPLVAGRAIKFTTKQPRMKGWVSVDEFNEYPNMELRSIVLTPNPANTTVKIFCNISTNGHASLKVYNSIGQLVKTIFNENRKAGVYTANWNGHDDLGRKVPAGIYFYNLEVNGKIHSDHGIIIR